MVELLLDGFVNRSNVDLLSIICRRSVLMLDFVFQLSLTLLTQSLSLDHAEVRDLLVMLATKANRILVSCTVDGVLVVLIPLTAQILLHNDYAQSNE